MLMLKALHVIFMVTWFCGLFYLPRLFVYHAMATDAAGHARFCVMERKLFWGIMTPGAVLTCAAGLGLLYGYAWEVYRYSGWLHVKLAAVGLTVAYHVWCGILMRAFARGQNRRSHVWYRVFNEVPVLFLVVAIIMVIVKPF
jgi:putative membrane protein